jgi:hypothetical protein
LKLLFVTHEIVISGFMLRRVESDIETRELAGIAPRPERYRPQANEKAFISRIAVRLLEQHVSTTQGTSEHIEEVSHDA